MEIELEWLDIWKYEPPRNREILFMTGDQEVHLGEIYSEEKLIKCSFHSFLRKCEYHCDSKIPLKERVLYWHPLPKFSKN